MNVLLSILTRLQAERYKSNFHEEIPTRLLAEQLSLYLQVWSCSLFHLVFFFNHYICVTLHVIAITVSYSVRCVSTSWSCLNHWRLWWKTWTICYWSKCYTLRLHFSLLSHSFFHILSSSSLTVYCDLFLYISKLFYWFLTIFI